jgi:hypothetical protein
MKPNEEGLVFTLAVDEMLQLNTLMLGNFADDKADFTAKVTDLADPFLDNWQTDTNNLGTIEMDDDYIDTQLLMTQAIDELMVAGRDQLQSIFFYAERAYPGNKAKLGYFGKDRYDTARRNPLKLHDLMLKCSEAVVEADYKDDLFAKGLAQSDIDVMKDTASKLKVKYDKRDKYMSGRKIATEKRNLVLNKIWKSMSDVSEASKLVYKNDYAKFQQYLRYHTKFAEMPVSDDEISTEPDNEVVL